VPYEIVEDPRSDAVLLAEVAAGRRGATARVSMPAPTVAFGRLDERAAGFAEAWRRAQAAGFAPVRRIAGGRAAAYHRGTVVIELFSPQPAAVAVGIEARFEEITDLVVGALRRLGVDAAVGELAGEYCPGRFSVHAGAIKLAGTAQRAVRGAALAGAFVAIEDGEALRRVLTDVYDALGLDWDPATAGAAEDLRPGLRAEAFAGAVREALGISPPG
jgi:lipoate-protein ligase A